MGTMGHHVWVWLSRRRVWGSGTDVCIHSEYVCIMCIQFEGPKSAEYTYSKAYPRVFRM